MTTQFRQQPQPSTKDKFRTMDVEVKNLQMASRVTQMMCQRLVDNGKGMAEDMSKLFQLVSELQYKYLAIQKATGVDVDKLSEIAADLRLKDFNDASDKQDAQEGFEVVDLVEEDSTVILTSTTSVTPDQGIFRSRIKLADCGVEELIQGLLGKPAGTKVKTKLNGVDHEVELLSVRRPAKPKEELSSEETQVSQ
jgi:hypothetical protein